MLKILGRRGLARWRLVTLMPASLSRSRRQALADKKNAFFKKWTVQETAITMKRVSCTRFRRGHLVSDETSFHDLIARVRGGDSEAATELVRSYEPAIRRIVRLRLTDSRLRRAFDSMDVCQSVFGSFFVRAALGQYELTSPEQLLKLLSQMARHKVTDRMRHERAERRDAGRMQRDADAAHVSSGEASPSREIAGRELLAEFRRRLSADERELADWRAQGREWSDIARERGDSPEALRKRLARALDRVSAELGLGEASDE